MSVDWAAFFDDRFSIGQARSGTLLQPGREGRRLQATGANIRVVVDIITGTLGKALGGASGGYVAARVAAYSVDDGKDPLSGPVDEPVLVGGTLPASVAAGSRTNRRYPRHTSKSLVRLAALQARPGFPQMREEQPAGQHQKRDQKE